MRKRILALAILIVTAAGAAEAAPELRPARIAARVVTGRGPCSENGGLGHLWVSNFRDATIARVDPATSRMTARIKVGRQSCGVATGEFNGTLARIDSVTNSVVATIKVGKAPRQVRYGAGAIWVGNHAGRYIYRVDPATNRARAVQVGLLSPD